MEALCMKHLDEDQKKGGFRMAAWGSTAEEDEETSVPANRRKVSFADAFGLDLVSIKEFVDATEVSEEIEAGPSEEFYLSCLFTAPSSSEELERSLEAQMVDLESIELLPGTTTLRGTVRVLNLCYSKSVYARITLDRWRSYFDIMADYVPGSSDTRTDGFTFQYTVVPPLEKEGTRVEFCLRYETSLGTFWANNKEMNYVMFCHQKSPVRKQVQRSCLKASRRGSAQEKQSNNTAMLTTEAEAPREEESAESPSLFHPAEYKPRVESMKNRQRAARLAHVKDIFSHRWGLHDAGAHVGTRKQSNKRPHVLTYHQIPLISLDWDNDNNLMDDIWTGRAKVTLSKEQSVKAAASVNDILGSFLNGKGHAADNDTSVCDVWRAFINEPASEDESSVPESEWLQTAVRVSSLPEEKDVRNATLDASAAGQALSHASQTSPDHVSPRGEDTVAAESHATLVSRGSVDTSEEHRNKGDECLKELTPMTAEPQNADGHDRISQGERRILGGEDTGGGMGHQRTEMEVREDEKKNEEIGTLDDHVIISNGQIFEANPEDRVLHRTLRHFPPDRHNLNGKMRSQECERSLKLTEFCNQLDPLNERVTFTLEDPLGINQSDHRQEPNLTENTNALEVMESRLDRVGDGALERPTDSTSGVLHETGSTAAEESGQSIAPADPVSSAPDVNRPCRKSNGFMWWTMLYILSHFTRFLTCSLPVAGFVVIVSLYDFLAFSMLYVFSCFHVLTCLLAWWFYKWKWSQGGTDGVVG
uniref:uncharacterized protein ppp1r3aa n=1 Tax=Doryrhamphus excisus TaxID=161450 RepID=UPI0025AE9171|nr:uncharacterized protein ppp1r3aa [Doryrhamphus excisus]XP_057933290.1 uncharacterized protein ppp1r3aa [Doryrhamphus excisus]XP_057933291.1 uncharacterized protein ppp1r3aa [Doryrhamphus excisus]